MDKVTVAPGCWMWRGAKTKWGGQLRGDNKSRWLAHRFAYTILVGTIPPNHEVRHSCGVKLCVNPGHLIATPRAKIYPPLIQDEGLDIPLAKE